MDAKQAFEDLRLRAQAEIERRTRLGVWTGGVHALTQYQKDPIGFAVEQLGLRRETLVWSMNPGYENHEWDGTPDPILAIAEALVAGKNVGVESATGTGKSHALGWLQLWFLACWPGARTFSYAAQETQLDAYSWTEIKKLWPRFQSIFPTAVHTYLRIRMLGQNEQGPLAGWGAMGRTAGVGADEDIAARAAGSHAEHMLILVEEAQGVPTPVSRAIRNTATDVHNLLVYVGNPDHQQDTLHRFCILEDVVHVRISAYDHPNVVVNNTRDPEWQDLSNDVSIVPGAVSRKSIAQRRSEYGEGDPIYQSRVRGISPAQSEESLIRWDWCVEAARRHGDLSFRDGLPALGVDVAYSRGGDKASIAYGVGAALLTVDSFQCDDPVRLGQRVANLMRSNDPPILSKHVGVDADAVGAGTAGELKRQGFRIRALRSASKAYPKKQSGEAFDDDGTSVTQEEPFLNLRAQMWWQLRLDLMHGRITLPWNEELFRQLCTPRRVRGHKIQVEKKDDIRARLEGKSTDEADAVVYWNWVRSRRRAPKPVPVAKKNPNEDPAFEEHMRRLTEAHDPSGVRRTPLVRRTNVLKRVA